MYMTFGVGGSDITSREAFKAFALNQAEGGSDKLLLNDLADLIFDMIDTDNSGEITKVELREHFVMLRANLMTRRVQICKRRTMCKQCLLLLIKTTTEVLIERKFALRFRNMISNFLPRPLVYVFTGRPKFKSEFCTASIQL